MKRLRWLTITLAPPLVYLAVLYQATRPPKAVYAFANPTVMTVTDKGGPAILHMPDAVYPAQALRERVEGSVTLKIAIAADGTVARAVPVSGPEPLRQAAADNVRQWQFEAEAQETEVDVGFSLRYVTRSLALPEPLRRTAPVYHGSLHGSVRVVATVDRQGRVEDVHPVMGLGVLIPAAVESVRQWTFRPMLRNGRPEYGTAVIDVPFGL
ncbi:MAG: TonB family protein [Candidatus Solibacter sp.]|nr:TonB family protein [Candidatus Solibacter sp.]